MIAIRPLEQHAEFVEAVRLQKEIWGFADLELLPVRLFITALKVGGQAFGAFEHSKMVAFCLAIPGLKPGGRTYLHSHMLGVLAPYRDQGLGRKLKFEQRKDALARGIDLMEWTFDPLEIKNAYFNIERLGAIVRRWIPNQYGTTTSHLHGGLPTDRLVAEWWMDSDRVTATVEGGALQRLPVLARVSLPANIAELRTEDTEQARQVQSRIGNELGHAFDNRLAVIGIERTPALASYLLGPTPAQGD